MDGFLLDVFFGERKGEKGIFLVVKEKKSKKLRYFFDASFRPYFLLDCNYGNLAKEGRAGIKKSIGKVISAISPSQKFNLTPIKKIIKNVQVTLLKIELQDPSLVPKIARELKKFGKIYEYEIPFVHRYCIDKKIWPSTTLSIERSSSGLIFSSADYPVPSLSLLSFDIETYNKGGVSIPSKDPVIMISYDSGNEQGVFSYGGRSDAVISCNSESDMIGKFCSKIEEIGPDIICGYNSDGFDLPYLLERAKRLGTSLSLGLEGETPKCSSHRMRNSCKIPGRVHFDVFSGVLLMRTVGAIRLPRLSLSNVYAELTDKKKVTIDKPNIYKFWKKGGESLTQLATYCQSDSSSAREIAQIFFPLELELSRITGLTLFDVSRATTGKMVEGLLERKAYEKGQIILPKPSFSTISARAQAPIEGAFVKLPSPGIYENIVVFDFRSLYPSIIISHNIDPSTLDPNAPEKEAYVSPQGHKFYKNKKGLVPEVLSNILKTRFAIKKKMEKLSADSMEYKYLNARQTALKILANSFFGYFGYARSRWYSRECAESITAWGRYYIKSAIDFAEKNGLEVIYGDTDSLFIRYGAGGKEKVLKFQSEFNKHLPESMNLELEAFYTRGIFVSKKNKKEKKGAKKKYALIDEKGKIKIKGFELVRRDWSPIAQETQRKVLEILLREGNIKKAVELVRKTVEDLKKEKMPLEKLIILTQLRKKPAEYEVKSPEVSAFLDAKKHGLSLPEDSMIGYIITSKGKTISEKAKVAELAKDYDADYYINNQVLPAVIKILGALGYNKTEFLNKGSQTSLGKW